MNEAEWLAFEDPGAMLRWLTAVPGYANDLDRPRASPRKLRLFACAACRAVWDGAPCGRCLGGTRVFDSRKWHRGYGLAGQFSDCPACSGTGKTGGLTDPRSRRAVEAAERYADGEATEEELQDANGGAIDACVQSAGRGAPHLAHMLSEDELRAGGSILEVAGQAGLSSSVQAQILRDLFGNPFVRLKVVDSRGKIGEPEQEL